MLRFLAPCLLLSSSLSSAASAEVLHGMAQVSRDDGQYTFVLMGTYEDRPSCESGLLTFTSNFIERATKEGHKAKLDAAACVQKVPGGTEFEALLKGKGSKHYIFYTPNMRIMTVHVRGSLEYERQTCEMMRGQVLSKLGVEGKCYPPRP
jgi:hypothetical protein